MKRFLKKMALMLVLVLASCTRDEETAPQQLEVTPNNISGIWTLSEVNGEQLPDGLYCYIEFVRRDRTYTMYQKFDSMYPRRITGVYSIEKDKYGRAILGGKYDYSMGDGEWNNRYFVTELLENRMVLTADSENADVCIYVRCNEVPFDVIEASK